MTSQKEPANTFDNTFGIAPHVMGLAYLLNQYNGFDDLIIKSFPYIVNEFTTGIALVVNKSGTSKNTLYLVFSEDDEDDSKLFVQYIVSRKRINTPTKESGIFTRQSYNNRQKFNHDESHNCAWFVYVIIQGYRYNKSIKKWIGDWEYSDADN